MTANPITRQWDQAAAPIVRAALVLGAALALLAALIAAPALAQDKGGEFTTKARQAILLDHDSGAVLFQHNAEQRMSPASMSKLMTLAVLFKAMKAGQVKPSDEFVMSENAWRKGGAPSGTSAMMVPVNQKARVDELILGIIVQSGNDAAMSVAEALAGSEAEFAKVMTDEGKKIGLKASTFANATGLYHPDHLTTARDLAVLARHIIREHPEQYEKFALREFVYRKHRFINRNPLLGGNGVDGLKTGYIKEAGYGMVASAKQADKRLIAVVNGLSTAEERRDEARKLLEWGFKSFQEFRLYDPGEIVGQARVYGGNQFYVSLTGKDGVSVMLPRFPANQKLKAEIVYTGPLKPPVRRGDEVARLRVTSTTNAVNEVPLVAAEDVEPAGVWRRGLDSLAYLALRWVR